MTDDIHTPFETLPQDLAQGDATDVRMVVHTIKSNSKDFGGTSLAGACQELDLWAMLQEHNNK